MKITSDTILDQADALASHTLTDFAVKTLPIVMKMINYAHTLDDQPASDSPEQKLAWMATKAKKGDLIFLQIVLFMCSLLPEEMKERYK